ncbi:MAG: glycosyltransferase, partial [Proteobacteria bacterium]|nr:glycosyltransferase [Pseudomonadota bacterium]
MSKTLPRDESLLKQRIIALTGGGTSGHVSSHLALLPDFRQRNLRIIYLGSDGIEKHLLTQEPGVKFYQIAAGKLRRYFSWRNFFDFFRVVLALSQSVVILWQERPQLLLSRGGYVSLPPALAAWL